MPNTPVSIDASVRALDLINRFGRDVENLMKIIDIASPIEKPSGTRLVTYRSTVHLADQVAAGQQVAYSDVTLEEVDAATLTLKKYKKGTTIEDCDRYGARVAVEKTDEVFLNAIEYDVTNDLFGALANGTLVGAYNGFQMALAMAKGQVIDKATEMQKNASGIVGFVNVLDFYSFLGSQTITVQTAFGMNYVTDFLGYKTLFLLGSNIVARGKIYATAVENLDIYYVNPANADFKRLGLVFETDNERPFLGVNVSGNFDTFVGDLNGLAAVKLYLTYLDLVANVTIDDSF